MIYFFKRPQLALKHHPDRVSDPAEKEKATALFAKIAHAYEILTDEYLRAEYNRSRGTDYYVEEEDDSEYEEYEYNEKAGDAMVVRDANAPKPKAAKKKKKKAKSKRGKASKNDNPTFKYHFSDPYEVFKRDFKDQFGFEYPGAKFDFVDFNTPDMPPYQAPGPEDKKKNGKKDKGGKTEPKEEKRGWLGRKKKNQDNDDEPKGTGPPNDRQLALVGRKKNTLANPGANSTALVAVEKKNNRPISCESTTVTDGPVTTTKMTFTRPDGTVETVTMKQGIPGPDPKKKKNLPALTNGPEKKLLLANGPGHQKLENGKSSKKKADKKHKQLTNGDNHKKLTSGGGKTLALTNGETGAKPKRKMLGWGGKQ